MKKLIKIYYLILLVIAFLVQSNSFAQSTEKIEFAFKSEYQNNLVKLRWAPTNFISWKNSLNQGWVVERALLSDTTADGKVQYQKIHDGILQTADTSIWASVADTSDAALAAAELLFGDSFEITIDSDVRTILKKHDENQMRFSFALTLADQSFEVARLMGLAIDDRLTTKDEIYFYRVYLHSTDSAFVSDTLYKVVRQKAPTPLLKIHNVRTEVKDTSVLMVWSKELYDKQYSFYEVLKSTDNKNYSALTKVPMVSLINDEFSKRYNFYKAKLPLYGDSIYYKIRGITPFGTKGPLSEPIAIPLEGAIKAPQKVAYDVFEDQIKLSWEFDEKHQSKIQHFHVTYSKSFTSAQQQIAEVEPTVRNVLVNNIPTECYVRVIALTHSGKPLVSNPIMVQLQDSTPPAKPALPIGEIDSTGLMTLKWTANTEKDVYGYKIYYAFKKSAEYSQLTGEFERDTIMTHKLRLGHLEPKIYVKLMAYDFRFNHSEFSDVAALQLPDTLPPSAPILVKLLVDDDEMVFEWRPSGSKDLKYQHITATNKKTKNVDTLLTTDNLQLDTYRYKPTEAGKFQFHILAEDESGNVSQSKQKITRTTSAIVASSQKPKLEIQPNYDKGTVELSWSRVKDASNYLIYRKQEEDIFRLYTTVKGNLNNYIDKKCTVGINYSYRIVAKMGTGQLTEFSKALDIKF